MGLRMDLGPRARTRMDWTELLHSPQGTLLPRLQFVLPGKRTAARRRLLLGRIGVAGGAVLVLDLARRLFRLSRLFAPQREPAAGWQPEAYGIPAGSVEEQFFETEDGEVLHGWYCRAEKPIGSVLYFHGNSGNLTTTAANMPHLLQIGLNVFLFDYRGFGKSSGRPSMSGIVQDGIDAARLHQRLRPAGLPSILYGFSLGGAIAAQVIRRHSFDALIFQSTFTTLSDITRVTYPRLPLHLLSGSFFNSADVIRRLKLPVLFLHGSADEVCPAWMGQALHDLCPSERRQMVMVEGGLHKDLFVRDPQRLTSAIREFVAGIPAGQAGLDVPANSLERLIGRSFRRLRRLFRSRK